MVGRHLPFLVVLTTSDIRAVAAFLLEHGYRSVFSADALPSYQAAIQDATGFTGSAFVDDLGFVADKDARRLYLDRPIDFDWLAAYVALEPPLEMSPQLDSIWDAEEWVEICGSNA